MTVEKRGDRYCVVHGHPQKAGSPTDKPAGTPIKCYSIAEYGDTGAREKAHAMHQAIIKSQERGDSRFVAVDSDGIATIVKFGEDQEERARELGAAFKKGFPETYTKSQTGPVYRESEEGRDKELKRLAAVLISKGIEESRAYAIANAQMQKKYNGDTISVDSNGIVSITDLDGVPKDPDWKTEAWSQAVGMFERGMTFDEIHEYFAGSVSKATIKDAQKAWLKNKNNPEDTYQYLKKKQARDIRGMAPGGPVAGYKYLSTKDIKITEIDPDDIKKARTITKSSYSSEFPIAVFKSSNKYEVIDGMHRLAESLREEVDYITVNVFEVL